MQASFDSLQNFLSNWQEIRSTKEKSSSIENYAEFFQQFSSYHQKAAQTIPVPPTAAKAIDPLKLAEFFTEIEKPLEASRHSALAFDPWRVIGLGRNEVRVVSILCWLLDPRGSHGYGPTLQQGLLAHIHQQNPAFPTLSEKSCRVRTETNLNGERGDRVDIEITSGNFHLIIEAKIDALEQPLQVQRYCEQAKKRAMQHRLPWAIIYLTPSGRKPACEHENLICLSWYQLSAILEKSMRNHQACRPSDFLPIQSNADFFVKTYLNHIHSL